MESAFFLFAPHIGDRAGKGVGLLDISLGNGEVGFDHLLTNGDTPTSDQGHYVEDHGLAVVNDANDCARIQIIRAGQVSSKVTITLYVP